MYQHYQYSRSRFVYHVQCSEEVTDFSIADDHGGEDDYDVGGAEGVNEDDDYDSFNQFDLDESGSAGPSAGRAHNESKGKASLT